MSIKRLRQYFFNGAKVRAGNGPSTASPEPLRASSVWGIILCFCVVLSFWFFEACGVNLAEPGVFSCASPSLFSPERSGEAQGGQVTFCHSPINIWGCAIFLGGKGVPCAGGVEFRWGGPAGAQGLIGGAEDCAARSGSTRPNGRARTTGLNLRRGQ